MQEAYIVAYGRSATAKAKARHYSTKDLMMSQPKYYKAY